MSNSRLPIQKRIIFRMIFPVLLVGIAVSVSLIGYLSPPMISYLAHHFESDLKLVSNLGLRICEENFTDLLNMRLEDNLEMNKSMQNQALEEIKDLSKELPSIQTLVLDGSGSIVASSLKLTTTKPVLSLETKIEDSIIDLSLENLPVKAHIRYFPFWDWTIISYAFQSDFEKPITTAKTIVYLSTSGVFVSVLFTLVFVFYRLVNNPLNRLIKATENVISGKLEKVGKIASNELGLLTITFNNMVESLDHEKAEVRHLLEEWQKSENKFRSLFENTPIGICLIGSDGYILETNESLQEILGFTKQELKQQSANELLLNKDKSEKKFAQLDSDTSVTHFEASLLKKDKSSCQAWVTITTTDLDGQTTLIAMVEDITGQKKLEKQLQKAQKLEAVGTLAGGVAHDLNNILSGLVSYPELLLMKLPKDSPLRKPIKTIQKSGLKAATIVQDLLTMARRGVATKEVVNLNNIVNEYLTSPEFEKLKSFHPQVTIDIDLAADLENVSGSPVHLTKTLMNLVSNAAEAIESEGRVKISTKNIVVEKPLDEFEIIARGEYVVIILTDNGIGLSEDDKEQIFEPFYTKKEMGRSGTGLGMTVVWGTVRDHDGFINLTSGLGQGTEISLYFPASLESLAVENKQNDLQDYMGKGERILIVDDIAEQREIVQEILTELNYDVTAAASGEEALKKIKETPVDLVVLDMIMDPGMDGLDTYKAILSIFPEQKAIIASGYSETDRVKKALKLGVGQYVKKPFTMEELSRAVFKELTK